MAIENHTNSSLSFVLKDLIRAKKEYAKLLQRYGGKSGIYVQKKRNKNLEREVP